MVRKGLLITTVLATVFLIATPALACQTTSWITTDPRSADSGTVVTVRGSGFEQGTVTLRWDASAQYGGAALAEALVAADGSIETSVTIPEASPGDHKIVAEHNLSSGEVTHPEAWEWFTIPGAAPAPAEEAPQQESAAQEEPKAPAAKTDERTEVKDSGTSPAPVGREVGSEVVATTEQPVAVAAPVEQRDIATDGKREVRPDDSPAFGFDRSLAEPAFVGGPSVEIEPVAAPQPSREIPFESLLAAAAGAFALLVLRRRRPMRPQEAAVHPLPAPLIVDHEEKEAA